jgi:hypothetical protein
METDKLGPDNCDLWKAETIYLPLNIFKLNPKMQILIFKINLLHLFTAGF